MKKTILFFLAFVATLPLAAQTGEKTLNRRYLNEIRDSLAQVVNLRGREMQQAAERTLAALPNDRKLYDESYISVGADLLDTIYSDGSLHLDLVFRISYNCRHIEGWTDDYALGTYDVDSSNSCRAICELAQGFIHQNLADVFRAGSDVEIFITSTADGTEFTTAIPYDGRYGEFRYCPVTFNGERFRVSVDRTTGITNNCQLAYMRAQAVRDFFENNVAELRRTHNTYRFMTQSFKDSVNTHYFRRSSIEMRVSDVFSETVRRMQAERMMDDYVDYNIPETEVKNPDTYVLIIANEKYNNALIPDVPYAANDGEVLRRYCVKALGVPERQVKVLNNASKAEIQQEGIHWLTDLAKAVAGHNGDTPVPQANVIIYYAGHGYTDLDGNSYLMPNNINTDDIESLQFPRKKGCSLFGCGKKAADTINYDIVLTKKESRRLAAQCLSLDELTGAFNAKVVPVKDLTIVIDASFDGMGRDGKSIVRADRPKSEAKGKKRKTNMRSDAVILLAADNDRTAYAFDEHSHGFLTYFLLKEIKFLKDDIFNNTYQDLYESIFSKLSKESALQNRWQEISGMAGGRYKDAWRGMKIK